MAGIWDIFSVSKKKKNPDDPTNDLEAVVSPKQENFLSQFLPEDPTKREAVAKALIMGGASAMAAGGPSKDPTNFLSVLGSGLGGGVVGYDKSLENASDAAYKNAAVSANSNKQKLATQAQSLMSAWYQKWGTTPGPQGYPPEAMAEMSAIRAEVGDDEGFRMLMKNIQQLQQTGAEKGFVIGEKGFQVAPGFGESLFDTKKAESLGSAVGQNAQTTTDQKNFEYGIDNPAFRAYEDQQNKSKATNVHVATAPKDGDIHKAMQEEYAAAKTASSGIRSIQEARHALNAGSQTGAFADTLLGMRKAAAVFGVGDTDVITNTETFRAAIAPQVSAVLKSTVGSANISNTDREFAEKAAGGSIELDATSINRLLNIMEKAQTATINTFNSRVDQLYPDTPENKSSRVFFSGVSVPEDPYKNPTGEAPAASAGTSAAPVTITSVQQFNDLPDGTVYIDPRTKKPRTKGLKKAGQ